MYRLKPYSPFSNFKGISKFFDSANSPIENFTFLSLEKVWIIDQPTNFNSTQRPFFE